VVEDTGIGIKTDDISRLFKEYEQLEAGATHRFEGFAGYSVQKATSAEQAQEVVRLSPPDLILMDIGLPDMDGLALTRKLKSNQERVTLRSWPSRPSR
jgi:CheY-like chemotaxis protein